MLYVCCDHNELRKVPAVVKVVGWPLRVASLKRFMIAFDGVTANHLWHLRVEGRDFAAVQVFHCDHWHKILVPVDPKVVRRLLEGALLSARCASISTGSFGTELMTVDVAGWEKSRVRVFSSVYRLPEDECAEIFTSRRIAAAKQLRGSRLIMSAVPEEVMEMVVSLLSVRDLFRFGGTCCAQREFVLATTHGLKIPATFFPGCMINKSELTTALPGQPRFHWPVNGLREAHEAVEAVVAACGFRTLAAAQKKDIAVRDAHSARILQLEAWLAPEWNRQPRVVMHHLMHSPHWKGVDYRRTVIPKTSTWTRRVLSVKVTFEEVKAELVAVLPTIDAADAMSMTEKHHLARVHLGINSIYRHDSRQRLEVFLQTTYLKDT